MNQDEALQTVKNIYALENNRACLSAKENEIFSEAINKQTAASFKAVGDIYSGDEAKNTLSHHDSRVLHEAVAVLSKKKK